MNPTKLQPIPPRPLQGISHDDAALLHATLTPESQAGAARGLRRKAATGAIWLVMSFAVAKILGFALNIILARLLTPADFGLVSFAMVVVGAFTLLQDLGLPSALIYSQRDIRDTARTALTINVGAALVLFGATLLMTPFMSHVVKHGDVAPVLALLALGLLFSSFGSVQTAYLSKELAFRRKFVADGSSLVVEAVVAVSLAFAGFGVWSLVFGYLVLTLSSSIFLWWVSPLRVRPGFDRAIARELIGYGKHVWLGTGAGFAANNLDYFIIGLRLSSTALGLYTVAYNVAFLPCSAVANAAKTALFPAASTLREDTQRRQAFFEDALTVVWTVSISLGIVLFIIGPAYMHVLLGEKWAAIDRPLQILVIYGVIVSIGSAFNAVYRSIGRPDIPWRFTLARIALAVPLMLFAVRFGMNAVALTEVIIVATLLPFQIGIFGHLTQRPLAHLIRMLGPHFVAVASVMVTLVINGRTDYVPGLRQDTIVFVTVLAIVAIVEYVGITAALNPRLVHLARTAIWRRYRSAATTSSTGASRTHIFGAEEKSAE